MLSFERPFICFDILQDPFEGLDKKALSKSKCHKTYHLNKKNLRYFWGNPFNTEFRPPWQMWPKNQSLEYLNQWSRWAWQALELWQLASPAKGWSLISFTALISDLYSLIHICNSIDPDILGGPGYSDDDAGVAEGHDENGEDPGEGEKVEEVCELLKIFWKDCFIIQLFCPSSLN